MKVGMFGGKFLPFHKGHLMVALQAIGIVDKLYIILSSSENRDRELCKRDNIEYMSNTLRMSWLGEIFSKYENVEIINVIDNFNDKDYDWKIGSKLIKKAIPEKITHIFGSEPQYTKHFSEYYPNTEYIVFDKNMVTISATNIRKNVKRYMEDYLPKEVKKYFVKKVAIVGTESCGKSILTKKLANWFNEPYIHEIGRDYCVKYSDNLTKDMFNKIAMEHYLLQEKKKEEANKIVFVDSDAIITEYYLKMYFDGERSDLIDSIIALQNFDLILYCEPNVKWVDDGLRFFGKEEVRRKNNEYLKSLYKNSGIEFKIIDGTTYIDRFKQAIMNVNELYLERIIAIK